MTAPNNNKKPSPKSTFIPIPSVIAKSPFENLNDGKNDRSDSIEAFLISEYRNQSQAFSLMPSIWNEENEDDSNFLPVNNDDEDSDKSVVNQKAETSSEEENGDGEEEEEDDRNIPLVPTDPKLIGLSENEHIKKLSCLLSSKTKDMHLHNNWSKHFLNLDLGFSNHAGVDFLILTKHAVYPGIKRRCLDESGNSG